MFINNIVKFLLMLLSVLVGFTAPPDMLEKAYENGDRQSAMVYNAEEQSAFAPYKINKLVLEEQADGVKLSWECSGTADNYKIYRATGDETHILINVATATEYLDKEASIDKRNSYIVQPCAELSAYELAGTASAVAKIDRKPEVPHELAASGLATGGLKLSWLPAKGADYYEVLRSEQADGPFAKIAEVKQGEFHDAHADYKTYNYYKIKSVKQSADSAALSSETELIKAVGYAALPEVKIEYHKGKVKLSWPALADLQYAVYKADPKDPKAAEVLVSKAAECTKADDGKIWGAAEDAAPTAFLENRYFVMPYVVLDGKEEANRAALQQTMAAVKPKLEAPELSSSSDRDGVGLSWDKVAFAEEYIVEKKNDGSYKQIYRGSATECFDAAAYYGEDNYYRAVAVARGPTDVSGELQKSDYSAEITARKRPPVSWSYSNGVVYTPRGSYNVGSNFVLVSIANQEIWAFRGGSVAYNSNCITGTAGVWDTPRGLFNIFHKSSPAELEGPTWKVVVSYWMEFSPSFGLHDATYRSWFGGDQYLYNGSHGCINLPYGTASFIYNNYGTGTPLVVY